MSGITDFNGERGAEYMRKPDPRLAPLAAALHHVTEMADTHFWYPGGADAFAAAILPALLDEGWELVPTGSADWDNGYRTGHGDLAPEIARLRKIEEAARALDESGYLYEIAKLSMDGEAFVATLHDALDGAAP